MTYFIKRSRKLSSLAKCWVPILCNLRVSRINYCTLNFDICFTCYKSEENKIIDKFNVFFILTHSKLLYLRNSWSVSHYSLFTLKLERCDCSLWSSKLITSLKLVDKFTYLGSSVSSTEKDIDTRLTKAWTAIDRLSIIWKSNLADKIFPGSGRVDTAIWMHYLDAN